MAQRQDVEAKRKQGIPVTIPEQAREKGGYMATSLDALKQQENTLGEERRESFAKMEKRRKEWKEIAEKDAVEVLSTERSSNVVFKGNPF